MTKFMRMVREYFLPIGFLVLLFGGMMYIQVRLVRAEEIKVENNLRKAAFEGWYTGMESGMIGCELRINGGKFPDAYALWHRDSLRLEEVLSNL